MEERDAGIFNQAHGQAGSEVLDHAMHFSALSGVECGSQRYDEFERQRMAVRQASRCIEHCWQVIADLVRTAAGQDPDPRSGGVERVFLGELLARDRGLRHLGQWVAHELGLNAMLPVEGLFKREDDQHLADVLLHQPDAVFLPGPQLRAYEIDDGDAEPMELARQAEMEVGKVDEHSHVGPPCANRFLQLAELAVDAWKMSQHFRQSHDGYVFRADDAFYAGSLHPLATHAEQLRCFTYCSKLLLD